MIGLGTAVLWIFALGTVIMVVRAIYRYIKERFCKNEKEVRLWKKIVFIMLMIVFVVCGSLAITDLSYLTGVIPTWIQHNIVDIGIYTKYIEPTAINLTISAFICGIAGEMAIIQLKDL